MSEWYGRDKVFYVRSKQAYGQATHLMTWTAFLGHKHTVCGAPNSGYDWKQEDGPTDSRPMCSRCIEISERACVQLEEPKVKIYEWFTLNFPSAISMSCPHCQHVLIIPTEGIPGRCPVCGYWHLYSGSKMAVSWEKMEYMPND